MYAKDNIQFCYKVALKGQKNTEMYNSQYVAIR